MKRLPRIAVPERGAQVAMRITTQLRIISTATIVALAVVAAALSWSYSEFRSTKNDYALADALKDNFFERSFFREQYFLNHEDSLRVQWEESQKNALQLLNQADAQFRDENDRRALKQLRRQIEESAEIFHRIIASAGINQSASNTPQLEDNPVYGKLDKKLFSLMMLKAAKVRDTITDLEESCALHVEHSYKNLTIIIGLFAIMLALFTIMTSMHLGSLIRKRLAPLHDGAKIVADGNLDYRISSAGSDEFAELALSINAMTGKLQAFTQTLETEIVERKQVENALRLSEGRLRAMLENELVGIVMVKDRNIQWANPAFEKMLGYQEGELNGTPTRQNYLSEEEYQALGEMAYPVLKSGKVFRTEIGHRRKDGKHIFVDMSGSILNTETGESLWGFVDISNRIDSEQELKRSNTELEQFSYAISHDMRQPLRMISSYLQLMKMSLFDKLDPANLEYFKFAIDGAQRLDQMLIGLLEYSRVGRKSEPFIWVESRALLDEALLFLGPAISEQQANIKIEGAWPCVWVSRDEIVRLLLNLISNAVKYHAAGINPEIVIRSEISGKHWQLSVTDNGIGIEPDQNGKLFQVFRRLQSHAKYEGNGIGLALCRRIAEHHGGRIWAESAGENQGSKFCIELLQEHQK
jgi:PAS domain S-box-containing protein